MVDSRRLLPIVPLTPDAGDWPAPALDIATQPERLFGRDSYAIAQVLRGELDSLDTRWVCDASRSTTAAAFEYLLAGSLRAKLRLALAHQATDLIHLADI